MRKKESAADNFSADSDRAEKNFDYKNSVAWLSGAEDLVRMGKAVESMAKDKNGDYIFAIRALNDDGSPGDFLVLINMTKFSELQPGREKLAGLKERTENAVIDKRWNKAFSDQQATEVYGTKFASAPEGRQVPVLDEKIKRALNKGK